MTDDDNSLVFTELDSIQKRIGANEAESIKDRWEFGRVLLKQRVGEQLPRGRRAEIKNRYGLEASEITRRMQLADKFKTEDKLVDACIRCGASWRQIISKELPKTPRKEKPEPSWAEFRQATLSRWLREVNGDGTRHTELLALLQDAVRSMSEAEVVTA